jgi:hypothetical protein
MVVTKRAYSRNEPSKTRTITANFFAQTDFWKSKEPPNQFASAPHNELLWNLRAPPKSARSHLIESASETNYSRIYGIFNPPT